MRERDRSPYPYLLPEEHQLLERYGLTRRDVFDGRGKSAFERRFGAKALGSVVVLRSPEGTRCGHRLATSSGHCIKCSPAALGFLGRCRQPGVIYVATAEAPGLVKVGSAGNLKQRMKGLSEERYGGFVEWVPRFAVWSDQAGKIELKAHGLLKKYSRTLMYEKDGRSQYTSEIFRCEVANAADAIQGAAKFFNLTPSEYFLD